MIVSPLVAAEIYKKTKPGVLYYSSILSVVAFIIMLLISLRHDAWKLGKVDTTGEDDETTDRKGKNGVVKMTAGNTTPSAKVEEQVGMTTENASEKAE